MSIKNITYICKNRKKSNKQVVRQLDMKSKQLRFYIYLLFAATFLILLAPIIPHHHHGDATSVCMKSDACEKESDSHADNHSDQTMHICECTKTDTITTPSSQSEISPVLFLSSILLPNPILNQIAPQPKSQSFYIHKKVLITKQYISVTSGLRAPPFYC